ncbi:MAG: carbohydrate kinase, partial [Marinilabilia sp.]
TEEKVFFKNGVPDDSVDNEIDLNQFSNFSEAYHRLIADLTLLNVEKINLILTRNDDVKKIYVSGGFARNEIYVTLLAKFYPNKEVVTSEVDNSTALGAALSIWDVMESGSPVVELGLDQ